MALDLFIYHCLKPNFEYNYIVPILIAKIYIFIKKLRPLDWFFTILSVGIIGFLIVTSLNQDRWIAVEFVILNSTNYLPNDRGEGVPAWVVENLKPGDVQYDDFGKKNLEILRVKKWGYQNKETWVTASVRAKYKSKQNKYTFMYQPLEVGRSINITVNGSNINGIVSTIHGFSDKRTTYDITVKARLIELYTSYSVSTMGIDPWVAQAVKKDEKFEDPAGKVLAKIIDVETRPAERVVTTSDGKTFITDDPIKKDVFITVQLNVIKRGGTYMFLENKPVLIGKPIPLFFDNLYIEPVITDILY